MEQRPKPSSACGVRALERGLDVLEYLQRASPATLESIHRGTGLPKTTALRLLATLQARGMVRRGLSDGRYRSGAQLRRLSAASDDTALLADAAAPILDRLCREIGWPSDLLVCRGTYMEAIETSRANSPIMINRDLVGAHVPMLISAVGRAYLAFCPEAERAELLRRLAATGNDWDRGALRTAAIEAMLEEVRRKGYGERDPLFSGWLVSRDHNADDKLQAIAVPILDGTVVHGCINLIWLRDLASVATMASAHLAALRRAADEIASGLRRS